jgi:plastocyanin
MADHKVTVKVIDKKVVCEPAELHVKRGHTISFGPIPHRGKFRGRLKQQAMAAAQGDRFHEHNLKDENLELGAAPSDLPNWTHTGDVKIHETAPFGAYAYVITVDTPEGPVDSDPVVIVEP